MAYTQKNNPIKRSGGKINDFIKNIGNKLKQGQKERGIFSDSHKEYMREREEGESKYDYNVRTRKNRKVEDIKDSGENVNTEVEVKEKSVNDLRPENVDVDNLLPSEPGDPYSYKQFDEGGFAFKLADGDWQVAEGESLKAIEERYKDIIKK